MRLNHLALALLLGVGAVTSVSAQDSTTQSSTSEVEEDTKEPNPEEQAKQERLDFMYSVSASYSGTRLSDGAELKIVGQPLLRFTNPLFGVRDGLFVAWVDPSNRPVAVGQVFLMRRTESSWYLETQSLAQGPMKFESDTEATWAPAEAGIEWKKFEDTVVPAGSKVLRLSQMRKLAARFSGEDDLSVENNVLRLMPNPMVRYGDSENEIVDGAMFAHVEGTDPELLVLIEARKDQQGGTAFWWALAPMTSAALDGYLDGQKVWSKPKMTANGTNEIFYFRKLKGSITFPFSDN
jgi:hypothetical protein